MELVATRTPVHLWIVGVVSLLWNAIGATDYTMTETRNPMWLAQMSAEQMAYIDSFPAWAIAFWALGVWGALAGSILLLARSRHAVTAFAISLGGAIVTSIWQHGLSNAPDSFRTTGALMFSVAIMGIAVALLFYARAMRAKGVLR